MRKITLTLCGIVAAVSMLLTGCKQDGSLDTSKVTSAFSSADSSIKSEVDAAIASVKAGDYAGALPKLQSLVNNVKLTPEQQSALKDFIGQVQGKVTAGVQDATKSVSDAAKSTAEKAGGAAEKTATDLQNSLKK